MVAGGYLVLDPSYQAFVTALSSRMHVKIEQLPAREKTIVEVESPQFIGQWRYEIGETLTASNRNPFLEASIATVFAYVSPAPVNIRLTLFSDPGYHTQEDTQEWKSTNGKKRFLRHGKNIEVVPKTGMGLSAGLVAVVCAALLVTLTERLLEELLDVIHNIAQIAHCKAQGKIGSGFDVAAAVYGSIVYRRFEPAVIDGLLAVSDTTAASYRDELRRVVDKKWDFVHVPCSLPPGIKLLLGDVQGGSETPKLVSQVLSWRKADSDSDLVYSQLDNANMAFMAALQSLSSQFETDSAGYMAKMQKGTLFGELQSAIGAIRTGLQTLTKKSGAEIEPEKQSILLDRCAQLPGCLGGVVPGAGGYDAICLLVEQSKLSEFKEKSRADNEFAHVAWLDLTEESHGLAEESAEDYRGL